MRRCGEVLLLALLLVTFVCSGPAGQAPVPLVSVIMPYTRREEAASAQQAVAALLERQTLRDGLEVIVAADGPLTLPEAWTRPSVQGRDRRLRVFRLKYRQGVSATRNLGLKHAQAPVVVFTRPDVLWASAAMEMQAWLLLRSPTNVTFCYQNHPDPQYLPSVIGRLRQVPAAASPCRNAWFAGAFLTAVLAGGEDGPFRAAYGDGDGDGWCDLFLSRAGSLVGTGYGVEGEMFQRSEPELEAAHRRSNLRHQSITDYSRHPGLHDSGGRQEVLLKAINKNQLAAQCLDCRPELNAAPLFDAERLDAHRRIAVFVPWFRLGGADRFNLNLVRALVEQHGVRVTLVATMSLDHPWLGEYLDFLDDVVILPYFLRMQEFLTFSDHILKSRRITAAVTINSEWAYYAFGCLRPHHPGVAFSNYVHMVDDWHAGGHARLAAAMASTFDGHIASSRQVAGWLEQHSIATTPVAVCPINVNTTLFTPDATSRAQVRARLHIPGSQVVILFAARLVEQKGVAVLLKVVARLCPSNPHVSFLVAGVGALVDDVRQAGPCLTYLGAVPRSDMPGLLAASDILFLPSKYEGIASVIFEAMATELVVVSADVGGQAELVTADTGYLLPAAQAAGGDDKQAESYAAVLLGYIGDSHERQSVGGKARRRMQAHFELEALPRCFLAALDSAHHHRRAATGPPSREVQEGAWLQLAWGMEQLQNDQRASTLWAELQRSRAVSRQLVAAAFSALPSANDSQGMNATWVPNRVRLLGAQRVASNQTSTEVALLWLQPTSDAGDCVATIAGSFNDGEVLWTGPIGLASATAGPAVITRCVLAGDSTSGTDLRSISLSLTCGTQQQYVACGPGQLTECHSSPTAILLFPHLIPTVDNGELRDRLQDSALFSPRGTNAVVNVSWANGLQLTGVSIDPRSADDRLCMGLVWQWRTPPQGRYAVLAEAATNSGDRLQAILHLWNLKGVWMDSAAWPVSAPVVSAGLVPRFKSLRLGLFKLGAPPSGASHERLPSTSELAPLSLCGSQHHCTSTMARIF